MTLKTLIIMLRSGLELNSTGKWILRARLEYHWYRLLLQKKNLHYKQPIHLIFRGLILYICVWLPVSSAFSWTKKNDLNNTLASSAKRFIVYCTLLFFLFRTAANEPEVLYIHRKRLTSALKNKVDSLKSKQNTFLEFWKCYLWTIKR